MVYLYPNGDTFTIYSDISYLPEEFHSEIIEIDALPEGDGILRRSRDGSVYYEPFLEPVPVEPEQPSEPVPVEPVQPQPVESIEDKLARMEQQLEAQQQQSLTILDVNLTLYEEVLTLREEIATLTGTGNV